MLYSLGTAVRTAPSIVHETSLAFSIFESSKRLVGSGRIESVAVSIGELSAVEPDLLEFAWEAVVADTPHAASQLAIDWRPARQLCSDCGSEVPRPNGSWEIFCPECGQPLRLDGGFELEILRITYLETGTSKNDGDEEPSKNDGDEEPGNP